MEPIRYTTNELENAIDYLEKAVFYFDNHEDKHRFKWLMITLHGALYSFGICNIKSTNSTRRVYKYIEKKELEEIVERVKKKHSKMVIGDQSYEAFVQYGTFVYGKVLDIKTVLGRCKSLKYMTQNTESKILKTNQLQQIAIDKLIRYRNDFAHFKPMGYAITGNYDIDIIKPVIEVVTQLALETNNVSYFEEESRKRVEDALESFVF
ncbi:hypothetical protein [Peribacillus butanolivorans]|uniref:hypothetical protein n=1 Tax=Peribacillus butanolivorans TaxID=421767 RepID=UPI0036628C41